MNTGFFLFGLVVLAGTLMLRGLPGRRRRTLLAAAAALAVGGVVLSLFPGSGEPVDEGAVDYHSLGALLASSAATFSSSCSAGCTGSPDSPEISGGA